MKLRVTLCFLLLICISFVSLLFRQNSFAKEESDASQGSFIEVNSPQKDNLITPDGFVSTKAESFGVSPRVRDIVTTGPLKRDNDRNIREEREDFVSIINPHNEEKIKEIVPGAGAGYSYFQDPLVGKNSLSSPQTMPTPILTFNGNTFADNASQGFGGLAPPDANGDVGPNHYVQAINLVVSIFNKDTGTIVAGPFKMSSLWNNFPPSEPCLKNHGDPVVIYDSMADRWLLSQFSHPHGTTLPPFYQCVAISKTGDPTGVYYLYTFKMPNQKLNDYPKFGVWNDAYYMTDNQFVGDIYVGAGIFALDRVKMIAGDSTASFIYKDVQPIDPTAGGMIPSDVDGITPPPEGLPDSIVEFRSDEYGDTNDALRIYEMVPNFSNPSSSTFTIRPDVLLAPFDPREPANLKDIEVMGGTDVASVSSQLMHRLAYRNLGTISQPVNSYVGNFTVNVSGVNPTNSGTYQAGIRWFELRRDGNTTTVFDQGTHNLDANKGDVGPNNWMGSIAQDGSGNLALGFSQSSATQRADIKWAGRTNNVAGGNVLNEGETTMYAATGSQTTTLNRWGDYSSMSVDPTDDCTFYYTQEYYSRTSDSDFSTRIGKFKFPNCAAAPRGIITGTVTFCETGAPLGDTVVQSNNSGYVRETAADGIFRMEVAPGTYTLIASNPNGYRPATQSNITVTAGQTITANICLSGIPTVSASNHRIVAESCTVSNSAADPGETVTLELSLQNTGVGSTTNLVATLQPVNGIINLSSPQNYGVISPGGAGITRPFIFKINPNLACGNTINLTWTLTDGIYNLGTISRILPTGALSPSPTLSMNFDSLTPPAVPPGWTSYLQNNIWITTNTLPYSQPNSLEFNVPVGFVTDYIATPPIIVRASGTEVRFKNWFQSEGDQTGMRLWMKVDDSGFFDANLGWGAVFTQNGYNLPRLSQGAPTPSFPAWGGGNSGGGATPVYMESVLMLPDSLVGKAVQFNWSVNSDVVVTPHIFRVDDVRILASPQCQASCSVKNPHKKQADFDGDGRTDISIFRPTGGEWWYQQSAHDNDVKAFQFGTSTDRIVPADYDGDGKTDIAFWRPSTGEWFVLRSSNLTFFAAPFGLSGDIPAPGDFDGDGIHDFTVYRSGTWFIQKSTGGVQITPFGSAGDIPQVADYDGDGKSDIGIYRPTGGSGQSEWWLLRSMAGLFATPFGFSSDKPVPADYTGDGKADVAFWRPSTGEWYILRSEDQSYYAAPFGFSTDIPVPGDYDGDGISDIGVFRPSSSVWFISRSTQGVLIQQFGANGDKPVAAAFIP